MVSTEHVNVKSSKIKSVGYDLEKKVLEVKFKNGHLYIFKEVPANFYIECLMADSVGRFFYQNIMESFPYTIIE